MNKEKFNFSQSVLLSNKELEEVYKIIINEKTNKTIGELIYGTNKINWEKKGRNNIKYM